MALIVDILMGLFLGMCYELFKALRKKIGQPFVEMLLDFFFWAVAMFFCVRLFLLTGDRKLRFYELFGVFCGFSCYFGVISAYFVKISEKIAGFFLFFLRTLFTIVKFFAIMIKNGVLLLWLPFGKAIRFFKRILSQGVQKWKQNRKLMKRI